MSGFATGGYERIEINGWALRAYRRDASLTQQQLGELAGLTNSQISHYETGNHRPSPHNLQKIADALGVSVAALRESDDT